MNAVVQRESAQVIQADAGSLMEVISRAAADPNTDVDKLERLLGMYERITAQQAKVAYVAALAQVQPNLPVIDRRGRIVVPAKDGKEGHSTPYARWEDINDAIRPVLHAHGFALSFRIDLAQDGKIVVTGVLSHRDGHQEETKITLTHDSTGSKNAVQAVGSSVAYGKRYTAMALLNITSRAPEEADDDGQAAGAGPKNLSEKARDAITEINACTTSAELVLWKKNKSAGLSTLMSPADLKEVIGTFNRRVDAMKSGASSDDA